MAYWQVFLKDSHLEQKHVVAQAMRDATKWAIMLIEDYCSIQHKPHPDEKEKKDVFSRAQTLLETIMAPKRTGQLPTPASETKPASTPTPSPEQKATEAKVVQPSTPQEVKVSPACTRPERSEGQSEAKAPVSSTEQKPPDTKVSSVAGATEGKPPTPTDTKATQEQKIAAPDQKPQETKVSAKT
jgi:hypothetical protein